MPYLLHLVHDDSQTLRQILEFGTNYMMENKSSKLIEQNLKFNNLFLP